MTGIEGVSAVTSATQVTLGNVGAAQNLPLPATALQAVDTPGGAFASMLTDGLANMDGKVAKADDLVARFVVDNTTPIHHVTVALEEARMAVELATQVRQRLTEGYRQLMNMQL